MEPFALTFQQNQNKVSSLTILIKVAFPEKPQTKASLIILLLDSYFNPLDNLVDKVAGYGFIAFYSLPIYFDL